MKHAMRKEAAALLFRHFGRAACRMTDGPQPIAFRMWDSARAYHPDSSGVARRQAMKLGER
eukprot:2670414-Pyramimonas_sp.AAC.1